MKKIILATPSILLFTFLLLLLSCKKSGNESQKGNFTWNHAGKSFEATESAAFTSTTYSVVPFNTMAGYGSFSTRFERRISFHLNSFTAGSYSIVPYPATVNTFDYIDDAGYNLAGTSGTVNITANANNFLSGNFSVTLINPSAVTSLITGNFTNVSITP
jgi:hypothetical protein